jgi:hypothetical protein
MKVRFEGRVYEGRVTLEGDFVGLDPYHPCFRCAKGGYDLQYCIGCFPRQLNEYEEKGFTYQTPLIVLPVTKVTKIQEG